MCVLCQKSASILGRSLGSLWVIIGKGSVIGRISGSDWQDFANFLRQIFAHIKKKQYLCSAKCAKVHRNI